MMNPTVQDEKHKKALDDCIGKVLSKLILHMDDKSENFRNLVLGCVLALPGSVEQAVRDAVEMAKKTNVHQEQVERIVEKIAGVSI